MQKSSFQEAFASIMKGQGEAAAPKFAEDKKEDIKMVEGDDKKSSGSGKVISGPASTGVQPILSRYKRPANQVREEKATEEAERARRVEKERQRVQGRAIPKPEQEEHERELVRIATKGIVELFNTVAEF